MLEILKVENLNGGVGGFSLNDISFSIERGSVMGLIGKNGSGKTTLIQTITGFLPRYSGKVLFDGVPMTGHEVEVKSKIGIVFDNLPYHLGDKPLRIVKNMSVFYENYHRDKFYDLMRRFDLPVDKRLIKYSQGMKNTFNIIMALCHNPDLIIMDEPTAGLDPDARRNILDVLRDFVQDERKSILFSTHITSDLEKIADYITMIDHGKTIFTKSVVELTDEMALCRISREDLTDELRPYMVGYRETSFGLECLVTDKTKFMHISNIQFARPTIEDVMTHKMGRGNYDEIFK